MIGESNKKAALLMGLTALSSYKGYKTVSYSSPIIINEISKKNQRKV